MRRRSTTQLDEFKRTDIEGPAGDSEYDGGDHEEDTDDWRDVCLRRSCWTAVW